MLVNQNTLIQKLNTMKNSLVLLTFLNICTCSFAQAQTSSNTNTQREGQSNAISNIQKKSESDATTPTKLAGVTFGFGAGYGLSFFDRKEYSLTTDSVHALKIGNTNKGSFVISSIITVRLGKVASKPGTNKLFGQEGFREIKKGKKIEKYYMN